MPALSRVLSGEDLGGRRARARLGFPAYDKVLARLFQRMTDSNKHAAIEPGMVLGGKFRIERVLGRGGMGVVVAAHHLQLDERVALKFLLPDALGNAEAVARFSREARAAVKIKSEHVARVTDVGTLDNGSPYMVMEYLHGTDLGDLVASQGVLSISDAVEFVLQACEAVAEAHAIGIVHRDLKPANLFLTKRADGSACIKVLDFGISKLTVGSDSEMGMTKTATIMGSPLYMSPEQMASSRDVDARTDIWAIGAIVHELVGGSVPFMAATMPQLCAKILQEPPERLSEVRPDVPLGLEAVVLRCLQKKPNDRYPTVAELAADLLPYAPRAGRVSVERITKVISAAGLTDATLAMSPSEAPAPIVAGGITQQAWGQSQATKRSGTRRLALGAALALGGLALGVVALSSRTSPQPSAGVAPASAPPVSAPTPPSPSPQPLAPVQPEPAASTAPTTSSSAEVDAPPATPVKPPSKAGAVRPKRVPPSESAPPRPQEPASKVPAVDLYQDRN